MPNAVGTSQRSEAARGAGAGDPADSGPATGVAGVTAAVEAASVAIALAPQRSWLARQWRTWRRKQIGLASLIFVVLLVILAVLGAWIAVHHPEIAKQ